MQPDLNAATASLLAKLDMGLVSLSDGEALMLSASESLEAHSKIRRPQTMDLFSLWVGALMTAAAYEKLEIKRLTGSYSEQVKPPSESG